jgi:hypothetical protein
MISEVPSVDGITHCAMFGLDVVVLVPAPHAATVSSALMTIVW